jgi:hypothetical protein
VFVLNAKTILHQHVSNTTAVAVFMQYTKMAMPLQQHLEKLAQNDQEKRDPLHFSLQNTSFSAGEV